MTQEGWVEDFWTTKRLSRPEGDSVRPLLKALAAARRSLDEDHDAEQHSRTSTDDAVVVDIRPEARAIPWNPTAVEFVPQESDDPQAAEVARAANVAAAADSVAAAAQAAAAASSAVARAIAARDIAADWMRIDPHQEPKTPPATAHTRAETQPAPQWGDLWRESVQGWVREADGTKVWRPIVTTTTSVPNWEIDTNLGMVTGESTCALDSTSLSLMLESTAGADSLRRALEHDRKVAQEAMVQEAVARGAHAVIGVNLDYTPVGQCLIVTSTGTAVTLRAIH